MKYIIIAVFTGFLIINPAFTQNDSVNSEDQTKQARKADRKKRRINQNPWELLKYISADERERLRKLHATNPKAFPEEVTKVLQRAKEERLEKEKLKQKERQRQNQQIKQLVNQYKNAKDDKAQKEAMDKLRTIIRKIFITKMQENKERLESLEKQVKKVRASYEFRQKNADKIIQARLDTLTQDTNFEW